VTASPRRAGVLLALAIALPPVGAAAAEGYEFMPKGGKALLLDLLGTPPDMAEFRKIARARHTEGEWRTLLVARGKGLGERQLATLAAYLAVHMPLPQGAIQGAAREGGPASVLPPDGRELAWKYCQSCHSLFASHLTQDRDAQGWRNMFLSPFHREMKVSPEEREEFARYSGLNMPMRIEDVPEDLRF
jgi:hypothetical protein